MNVGRTLLVILFIFWNYLIAIRPQFIRLLELENKIPSESALSEFQASIHVCLTVCSEDGRCRALFHTGSDQHCGLYTSFDYLKLNEKRNTVSYGRYSTTVALGKPTEQSSLFVMGYPWYSHLAVDGSMHTHRSSDKYPVCTHTRPWDHQPWWYVDLKRIFRILSLKILTRGEISGHRLMDVDVVVGQNASYFDKFCGNYYGPAEDRELVTLNCASHTIGRLVKLVKPRYHNDSADDSLHVLSLCEVQITVVEN